MASQALFDKFPPFPDGLPLADIHTISLAGLQKGVQSEQEKVLHAAKTAGFFLLDLHNDDLGEKMIQHVDNVFGVMEGILDEPEEVKKQFAMDGKTKFLGYKFRGISKIDDGLPDRVEWFQLGLDGLADISPGEPLPPVAQSHAPLLKSFGQLNREISHILLAVLATQLNLPVEAFNSRAIASKSSNSMIRMIRTFASTQASEFRASMSNHQDIGTITLLTNILGGLQIVREGKRAEDEDAWRWVKPQPGCLIVNLGDTMQYWTGGLLRSVTHRIYHAPGEQSAVDRFSLVTALRPEKEASMKNVFGGNGKEEMELPAWQWEEERTRYYFNAKQKVGASA